MSVKNSDSMPDSTPPEDHDAETRNTDEHNTGERNIGEDRVVASEPLPLLITEQDQVVAKRARAWVMAGLIALSVAGATLGYVWWQRGTWSPDFRAPNPAVVCPVWSLTPAEPREVTLNVFNASQREGIATDAANHLRERGFDVKTVRNATLDPETAESVAMIYAGPEDTGKALAVQKQIPGSQVVLQPDRTNGILDLALGVKYKGVAPVEKIRHGNGMLNCTKPWFER